MSDSIDVEELLENPRATLLPLLRRIQGWGQVQSCCPLCSAQSAVFTDEGHSKCNIFRLMMIRLRFSSFLVP